MEIPMNTTQKPDPRHSHGRKPAAPQRDDAGRRPGQSGPANPDRQGHRDAERHAPHKK